MTKIKCILFDAGNVLLNYDNMTTCRRLASFSPYSAKEIFERIFASGLAGRFEEGMNTDAFYEEMQEIIQLDYYYPKTAFRSMWNEIFWPNSGIENVLDQIKSDIRKMVISNTDELHWARMKEMPIIKNYFPEEKNHILSFKVKDRKPSETIFNEALKRTNIYPTEILYIDDIPEYVEYFNNHHGYGIIYDCRYETYDMLFKKLEQFNIFNR